MRENKEKSTHKLILYTIAILVILVMLILDAAIQIISNSNTTKQTSGMLMYQIISIMNGNKQDESEMIQNLKNDYIVRAQAVAYMLSNNNEAANDIMELTRIAGLMSVDEIHLFDTKGEITGGTNPKYYGFNFDSGEQISYFKPMLTDKSLSMCQDVTPNTAEGKSMMYAIVWNDNKDMMVQVGIEPKRLLEELSNNSVSSVVATMPMYEGVQIYVADKTSGIIMGSSDLNTVDKQLGSIGFGADKITDEDLHFVIDRIKGELVYCASQVNGDYLVVITHNFASVNNGILATLIVAFVYICIVLAIAKPFVARMNKKLREEREERIKQGEKAVASMQRQLSIIDAVSKEFTDVILIDTSDKSAVMLKVGGKMMDYKTIINGDWKPYNEAWKNHIDKFVLEEDAEELYKAIQIENVEKILETSDDFFYNYRIIYQGQIYNYQVKFVYIGSETNNRASIVASFQNIDDILEAECNRQQLEKKVNFDELTGMYNRRAYEDDMSSENNDIIKSKDFAVIAMDVNGLKIVNDSFGHEAGDELLKGAAACMKHCFGAWGKIYRTGGDEFFALICAGEEDIAKMSKNFEYTTGDWSGIVVKELSVAYGIASKKEFPNMLPLDLAKIADSRMYKYKQSYYSKFGMDRRGQHAVFKNICESYIKIVKVNLTEDSYQPIQANPGDEQLSGKFSKSLVEFGHSDMLHEDDRENYMKHTDIDYLRRYFREGNKVFRFNYKRKMGEQYESVMLEMLTAPEYTDANQVVYLYVKDIEIV